MIGARSGRNWRQISLCVTFALTLTVVSCVDDNDGDHVRNTDYSATAEFSYAFSTDDLTRISLDAVSGEVHIAGVADSLLDSIVVRGERRVESESTEDAQVHLPELQVVTTVSEQTLVVRTEQPDQSEGCNYIVSYHIEIPEAMIVTAGQVNGPVWVTGMTDTVIASSVNGNLHISRSGTAVASVVNGVLSFEEYYGSVQGSVVNGGIQAHVALPTQGTCNLSITNGNIDLEIPDTTSSQLSAHVVNGVVTVQDLTLHDASISDTAVTGTLGGGDGQISLSGVNGNILIRPSVE